MLKDMVVHERDIIDEELLGMAGSLSSVTKWEKLWLAQVGNCHTALKIIWTQVIAKRRLKEHRVLVRWVLLPHTEVQAPMKHLRKEQTSEVLPSDDEDILADSLEPPPPPRALVQRPTLLYVTRFEV